MGEARDCHRETVTAHEDPMYRAAGSWQRGPLGMRVQRVAATILKGALAIRVRMPATEAADSMCTCHMAQAARDLQ